MEQKATCPKCKSEQIRYKFTCHTWPTTNWVDGEWKETWKTCVPCDSAYLYFCLECDWNFTWGLNPNNPRNAVNMLNKPEWVPEKREFDKHGFITNEPKNIRWGGESE